MNTSKSLGLQIIQGRNPKITRQIYFGEKEDHERSHGEGQREME